MLYDTRFYICYHKGMKTKQIWYMLVLAAFGLAPVIAFCGFYVAKADAKLYNKASQVVIARDGNRTNITMVSDYQGEVKDFAMVVPVPVVLQKEQVRIVDPAVVSRLDAYSAPRLVEYFDEDPCRVMMMEDQARLQPTPSSAPREEARNKALGVTVEAQFSVGEYDIVILSAKESGGLETWLIENGYKMPNGARAALRPYIDSGMKFFVAKVNLENYTKGGTTNLRPIQMSFESAGFMLPLKLGMVNAAGAQDLIVYALTRRGRVETVNYPTVEIPSNVELPEYVQKEFSRFYKTMFSRVYERENKQAVFVEYGWPTNWCDPCAAQPPTLDELQRAGAGWIKGDGNVYLTRLHVRYDRFRFKEDLMFRETPNQNTFQGRYIMRHAWKGDSQCSAAEQYRRELPQRLEAQAQTLANLTGWDITEIRKKAGIK